MTATEQEPTAAAGDPLPRPALTARQRAVLSFLVERWGETQRYPAFRELCDRFGFRSTNAVAEVYRALAKKGYVRLTPDLSRSVEVIGLDAGSAARAYLATLPG